MSRAAYLSTALIFRYLGQDMHVFDFSQHPVFSWDEATRNIRTKEKEALNVRCWNDDMMGLGVMAVQV